MASLPTKIGDLDVELTKYKKQLENLEGKLETAEKAQPRNQEQIEEIKEIKDDIRRKEDDIRVKEVRLTGLEALLPRPEARAQPGWDIFSSFSFIPPFVLQFCFFL